MVLKVVGIYVKALAKKFTIECIVSFFWNFVISTLTLVCVLIAEETDLFNPL